MSKLDIHVSGKEEGGIILLCPREGGVDTNEVEVRPRVGRRRFPERESTDRGRGKGSGRGRYVRVRVGVSLHEFRGNEIYFSSARVIECGH